MRKIHRLRPLKMRVAGDDDVAVPPGEIHERPLQVAQQLADRIALVPEIQPDIQRDLIVPRARRVQLRAGVADALRQLGLDVHVDVLQLRLETELSRRDLRADFPQALDDLRALLFGNQPRLFQRRAVRDGALDVMPPQPPVEADALAERLEQCGGLFFESAFPHRARSIPHAPRRCKNGLFDLRDRMSYFDPPFGPSSSTPIFAPVASRM